MIRAPFLLSGLTACAWASRRGSRAAGRGSAQPAWRGAHRSIAVGAVALLAATSCGYAPLAPRPALSLHEPVEPLKPPVSALPTPSLDEPLTISGAVEFALRNYPQIRAAQARLASASSGVDVAKTAYLPRLDLLWQEVQATHNNISGTLLPQGVIPNLSGAVTDSTTWTSRWGSAAGMLLSWEPVDFGLRNAQGELARAGVREAEADSRLTQLDAASSAAESFLRVLAAEDALRTAEASVERWQVFAGAVRALALQQLRPGADLSRAEAQLAAARTQSVQAEQLLEVSRIALGESLGLNAPISRLDLGPMVGLPPPAEQPPPELAAHPLAARQTAALEMAQARTHVLECTYFPRVMVEASLSGRGSGFGPKGNTLDADQGFYPDRGNWAAGLALTFPVMDYFANEARIEEETANEKAEEADLERIALSLQTQQQRAHTLVDAARRIAENTPVELKAAQDSFAEVRARYGNGLTTLSDVAETEQLLARAEVNDALARLNAWQALLLTAKAGGDLQPFLDAVSGGLGREP